MLAVASASTMTTATASRSLAVAALLFASVSPLPFAEAFSPPSALRIGPPSLATAWSAASSSQGRRGRSDAVTGLTMVRYDDLMERMPSKSIIDAAEKANGGPVIASDVAAEAGVSLSQARKDLSALAALSRGDIAVSSDGELLYRFPSNLSSAMSSNNAKFRALSLWREKVKPVAEYATKVGFGVVLLVSLFAIFSTIFFAMQSSNSSSEDNRRDNRRGGGMPMFSMFWGPSPFDFFYYRPYYSRYYSSPAAGADNRDRDPDEMGFLESVFSYVFGDGDPNGDLEERRIGKVADMVRKSGGAVTAEQLAPFCDDAPMPESGGERSYVDESFVLPIVTQLDGEPQVTEDGDIVYVFPELMTSASSSVGDSPVKLSKSSARARKEARVLERAGLDADSSTGTVKQLLTMNGIDTRGALERSDLIDVLEQVLPPDREEKDNTQLGMDVDDATLLQEREYTFSLASDIQKILSGVLGAINLGGALYLGNILAQYAEFGVRLPSYFGLVQSFYPLLLGYAILYNIIPVVRNFRNGQKNDGIRQRNKVRREWRTVLEAGVGSVKRKLAAASKMGKRVKNLGAAGDDVVFDTREGMEGVEMRKQESDMKDFDRLLEKEKKDEGTGGGSWE